VQDQPPYVDDVPEKRITVMTRVGGGNAETSIQESGILGVKGLAVPRTSPRSSIPPHLPIPGNNTTKPSPKREPATMGTSPRSRRCLVRCMSSRTLQTMLVSMPPSTLSVNIARRYLK
jgi:hypothetical protein